MNKQKAKFGYEIIECPICHKNTFNIVHFPNMDGALLSNMDIVKDADILLNRRILLFLTDL